MTIPARSPRHAVGGGASVALEARSLSLTTVTWAELQALTPADYEGDIYRVSDVGTGGGGSFVSDGTYWVPLNGHLVLDAQADLGLTSTTPGNATVEIAGWSLSLPANLFRKPGSFLRGVVSARLTGTISGTGYPGIKISWGSGAGDVLCGGSNLVSTANNAIRGHGFVSRVSDTQVRSNSASGNYGAYPGVDNYPGALRTLSATADQTLKLYGNVSSSPGSGETLNVDNLLIELVSP